MQCNFAIFDDGNPKICRIFVVLILCDRNMDNMTVSSTNYIPLQPPYRIIKHGNKIGVQIGIQMVTYSGGSPQRTETHNYPAVAAEDRITPSGNKEISFDSLSDFEVWDNVETKRVSVLGIAGVPLSWMNFIKILWHDHDRMNNRIARINKVFIYKKIVKYNKSQELPSPGIYSIHLHTESSESTPQVVCSARDDVFALYVEWTDDQMVLEKRLLDDLHEYLLILSPGRSARFWVLKYKTDEDRLRPLVDRLNANKTATSFKNTLMASIIVTGIPPYEEYEKKDTTTGKPSPSSEQKSVADTPAKENDNIGAQTVILKPNLNADKICEDLSKIKESEKDVIGIPFWFVVHNFFETIGWLEELRDTKFIAWVETKFGWEWSRKDFKRILPRFKCSFENWTDGFNTDKKYSDLAQKIRNTYQQQNNDGSWVDKDIYYKENKKHYN